MYPLNFKGKLEQCYDLYNEWICDGWTRKKIGHFLFQRREKFSFFVATLEKTSMLTKQVKKRTIYTLNLLLKCSILASSHRFLCRKISKRFGEIPCIQKAYAHHTFYLLNPAVVVHGQRNSEVDRRNLCSILFSDAIMKSYSLRQGKWSKISFFLTTVAILWSERNGLLLSMVSKYKKLSYLVH